jgi:hypothetical protein
MAPRRFQQRLPEKGIDLSSSESLQQQLRYRQQKQQ